MKPSEFTNETTGVTDFNPKSQGGTRKELLAKYAKSKSSADATAARKAGASQDELKKARELTESQLNELSTAEKIRANSLRSQPIKAKIADLGQKMKDVNSIFTGAAGDRETQAAAREKLAQLAAEKSKLQTQLDSMMQAESVTEESDDDYGTTPFEAYGVRGLNAVRWQRKFKNGKDCARWCEKYDAEVFGTRDLESAKRGNLSPTLENRDEKRCTFCGREGHSANNCPLSGLGQRVTEDGDCGGTSSASIAAGPAQNLLKDDKKKMKKVIKRSAIGEGIAQVTEGPAWSKEVRSYRKGEPGDPDSQAPPKPRGRDMSPTIDLSKLSRDIERAVGNAYPDSEPTDYLWPMMREQGVNQNDIMQYLDRAAKQYLGAADFNDYVASAWDQFGADNPDSNNGNPWK